MKMNIEKDSVVPRYLQVKRYLKTEILANRLSGKIPSERELASQCGVSYLTVRRAVGELVDEGLLYRERGRGTFVAELGKVSKRTYNIGFVISASFGVANNFFSWMLSGVEAECRKNKYSLFVATNPTDLIPLAARSERQYSRKVDGIIAVHIGDKQGNAEIVQMSRFVPVVLLNRIGDLGQVPSVLTNNTQGARDAMKYLIELGHKRIAHISGPITDDGGCERTTEYKKVLSEASIEVDESLIANGQFTSEGGYEAASKIMSTSPRPTAIFCANDTSALGAIQWCMENGLSIPGDVSIMGFDDVPAASQCYPKLTTMRIPKEEIGKVAFRTLQKIIDTGSIEPEEMTKVLPIELIVRDSCRAINE